MGEKRNAYSVLVAKPGGNIPPVEPRHRREGNIKIKLFLTLRLNMSGVTLLLPPRLHDVHRDNFTTRP
jgi:hypothetical protein